MSKTTSDLLTSIKRRAQLPDDGGTLSDSDILAFASDELVNVVAPRLIAMDEWHFAFSYSQTLSSTRTYRLSSRCSGNRIISVEYYDGTGYRFIRLRHPLMQSWQAGEHYSIYGNQITLSDACPTTGTLRIRALARPSQLVTTGCTAVSAANSTTQQLTVTSSTGFSAGQLVDLVYADSPYEIALFGVIQTVDDATHVTLNSVLPVTPQIQTDAGQGLIRLCPADQSDRVALPDELHDYLAQRTAIRCMEARGFTQDMQNHLRKLADLEAAFDRLVSPRSKGEFKAIVPEDWYFVGRV